MGFMIAFSGPTNVLYDPIRGRPAFIDFEGCHIHEGEIQKCTLYATNIHDLNATSSASDVVPERALQQQKITRKLGASTATNARLPELSDPCFDVFAADVWCLGAMLRDVSFHMVSPPYNALIADDVFDAFQR